MNFLTVAERNKGGRYIPWNNQCGESPGFVDAPVGAPAKKEISY